MLNSFVIVYDKLTLASRGYGFVNCENAKTCNRILEEKNHVIKGRVVEITKALKKNGDIPKDIKSKGFRKLFVGGLSPITTRGKVGVKFRGSNRLLFKLR